MAINLEKGQRIDVGLSRVRVTLGWTPNVTSGADFDLDASAFMLDDNKKLPQDEFFVFYNNQQSPDHAVTSSGDDLTGNDGEALSVDLDRVDPRIQEILFVVTIHEADKRRQNFGQVRNSYIAISNEDTGEEIARYDLDEDFSIETAVEFGRLYKRNGSWRFEAMGTGYRDGLKYFVELYA